MQVLKRGVTVTHQKPWMRGVFLVVIWLLIVSMSYDFWQTKQGFLRIKETEKRLIEAVKENQDLINKMSLVRSAEYKDKLVREKLNMQLPNEVVVILPNSKTKAIGLKSSEVELTNWEKWLEAIGIYSR